MFLNQINIQTAFDTDDLYVLHKEQYIQLK